MSNEQVLSAFQNLLHETRKPILVRFQNKKANDYNKSPFTEVIEAEFKNKLRQFEIDGSKCQAIIEHYSLPKRESAIIFDKTKNQLNTYPGFKNVRNYLRALSGVN